MATTAKPVLNTAASKSVSPINSAPAVQLAAASTTQVPVLSYHAITYSAGEQPIHFVKMKDGTVVPIPENQLTQNGATVTF